MKWHTAWLDLLEETIVHQDFRPTPPRLTPTPSPARPPPPPPPPPPPHRPRPHIPLPLTFHLEIHPS